MLIGVFGDFGKGKTLLLVFFLKYLSYTYKFANFKVNIPNVKTLSLSELLSMNYEQKSLICIDELYLEMDSRRSMKKKNIDISHIIFQSRKRKVDIVYASQLRSSIDLRVRDLTNFNIIALGKDENENFHYYIIENNSEFVIPSHIVKQLYNEYNTYEIVEELK